MQLPLLFEALKWLEIEEMTQKDGIRTIVIPFGPVEEHGPHMGLGVDYIRPWEVAIRAGIEVPFFIHPALPVGVLTKSRSFPGSVSVEPETLKALMTDIYNSCRLWGMKHIIFLSGHGGTRQNPMTDKLIPELNSIDTKVRVYLIQISDLNREAQEKIFDRKNAIHAAEQETSEMLYVRPDIVEMDKAVAEFPDVDKIQDYMTAREHWKTGVRGDATIATREKGEKIVGLQIEELIEFVKSLQT